MFIFRREGETDQIGCVSLAGTNKHAHVHRIKLIVQEKMCWILDTVWKRSIYVILLRDMGYLLLQFFFEAIFTPKGFPQVCTRCTVKQAKSDVVKEYVKALKVSSIGFGTYVRYCTNKL